MTNFNRNDTINLFSKLSFRRAWNWAKVFPVLYLSKWTGDPFNGVCRYPFRLNPPPAVTCDVPNAPADFVSFTRPSGMLEMNFFRK